MGASRITRGMVVDGRFEILTPARRGGMGVVYQATDRATRSVVALKVLNGDTDALSEPRFAREVQILAELRHPGIVRYVDHGRLSDGEPFLAMDWLDGIDLSARLERGRLPLAECVRLLSQATGALAEAHRRGVLHRDIKPENIFLRDGRFDQIVILDFGIARLAGRESTVTLQGTLVGTPEYMAPEQARGEVDIGPGVDIFSLGCVLFRCVTGRSPFPSDPMAAILTKLLCDDVPKVNELREGVPSSLADLLHWMLKKRPELRPKDASALQEEIAKLGPMPADDAEGGSDAVSSSAKPLTSKEQRLLGVVIASARGAPFEPREPATAREVDRRIIEELEGFGARATLLNDGSLVAAISRLSSSAVDLVNVTARVALLLKERWPDANVVLTAGRGTLQKDQPASGEAVERAVALMRSRAGLVRASPSPSQTGVWVDDASASLLGGRFLLAEEASGVLVIGERATVDESRLLLGKPTPCVGRDVEIAPLEALFTGSIEASVARAVLITAAAGMGKSRVRHELLRRLSARFPEVRVLLGRGDPLRARSPYGIVSQALRQRFGVHAGVSVEEQRARLMGALPPSLGDSEARRLGAFLGELCGVYFPDEACAPLRAARLEPKVLGEEIQRAFLDWLKYECAGAPVVLVLEDLQWGDPFTIHLAAAATRELADLPLLVLGVARPEVVDLIPKPWPWLAQEVTLRPLSKRACDQLIRGVIGEEISAEALAQIVHQSEGNALFLEELIRAFASGRRAAAPETLIMMLQARLLRLHSEARRLLRAGSLFGEAFFRGGVRELHGKSARDADEALNLLIREEIVEPARESRFPGEVEHRFRHSLLREAAYGLLVEEDRAAGHAFVSRYLERVGEADPMVIAEHASLGGDNDRALRFYQRAASLSWERNDVDGTLARIARCLSCDPKGEALGVVRALSCLAYRANMRIADAFSAGDEAIGLLRPGSLWWCRTMAILFFVAPHAGHADRVVGLSQLFLRAAPEPDAMADYAMAASSTATMLAITGARSAAKAFLAQIEGGSVRAAMDREPIVRAAVLLYQGWVLHALEPSPYLAMTMAREGFARFEPMGLNYYTSRATLLLGATQTDLGDLDAAEGALRQSLALATSIRERFLEISAWMYLALALSARGDPASHEEASRLARAVIEANAAPVYRGGAYLAIATVLLSRGEPLAALEAAQDAYALLRFIKSYLPAAVGVLIRVLLALDRVAEARAAAAEGMALLGSLGGAGFCEVVLRESAARAYYAAGELDVARGALREALRQIEIRALTIPDPSLRARYIEGRPENVRVLELAIERLGQEGLEHAAPTLRFCAGALGHPKRL